MSFSNGVAILIIPEVQISLGGRYTCLAENEAGSQTSVGELIVKGSCRSILT
jgi:titin